MARKKTSLYFYSVCIELRGFSIDAPHKLTFSSH